MASVLSISPLPRVTVPILPWPFRVRVPSCTAKSIWPTDLPRSSMVQELPGVTTIMKEYSRAYTGEAGEIPYYAIINPENNALYQQYKQLAGRFPNLHLLGRLAEYKYYNMDAIARRALDLAEALLTK